MIWGVKLHDGLKSAPCGS